MSVRPGGALPADAPPGPRGPGHPHLPRGGGRVRAPGAAVLGRQGLHRHAAPGQEGLLPGADPFPVLHIDTGRNFDEVIEFRDRHVAEPRGEAGGGQGAGRHRRRAHRGGRRARATRNRLQTPTLLRAIDRGRLRRRLRRGPARRGEGPGQGTHLQFPRRVRAVGPQEPAPRAVEPLQRAPPPGRAHPGLPALELDRARCVAVHQRRGDRACRPSTSPTAARSSSATACSWRSPSTWRPSRGEEVFEAKVRFRTVGDADCTGCVESTAGTDRPHHRRGGRDPADRAGATRADDRISEAGMEDRKREGYF